MQIVDLMDFVASRLRVKEILWRTRKYPDGKSCKADIDVFQDEILHVFLCKFNLNTRDK